MAFPAPARSADWAGGDGNWSDASQWVPATTPDAATDVGVKSGTVHVGSGTVDSRNAVVDTGGKVEVSGGGTVWDNSGSSLGYNQRGGAIVVGETGVGTLDISNGGTVKTTGTPAGTLLVGDQAGSTGTVNVGGGTGTSTLENAGPVGYPGNFYVGYDGTGVLNVNAGGTVSGFDGMALGIGATGVGTLNVDGGSVDVSPGNLDVGQAGRGTLVVKNGGTVESRGGTVSGNGGSAATVTGAGSAWHIGSGGLKVGYGQDGSLSISDHGVVDTAGGQFYLGQNAGSAALTLQSGGTLKTHGAVIGQGMTGTATQVSITGAGSSWDAVGTGDYFWAYSGAAGTAIDVTAGGSLMTSSAIIGDVGTADTAVTVDGAGSSWSSTGNIFVGYHSAATSSTGTLNLTNGGAVTASALKLYAPGTLNLGTGGLAGTFTGALIVNDGRIVADFTDAAILDSAISGSGTLTKKGTGTLTLNGASTAYAGTTSVDGGTLTVGDGTHPGAGLAGGVSVNATGTLGGIGTLEHVTIASGGTLAPGNSIGTINVADVAFDAGSTYAVEVDAGGHSDKTVATGAATINGGTVKVLAGSGSYAARTDYTILTAAGGRTGMFDGVISNLAFLTPSLGYDADSVYLTMTRNGTGFAAVGLTPNQRAAGAGSESLGTGSSVYGALVDLSADQARDALDQLAGAAHASAKGMLLEGSAFVRDAIDSRLRSVSGDAGAPAPRLLAYGYGGTVADSGPLAAIGGTSAPADTGRFAAWGSTFGSWGATDGDGNAAGLHRSTGGFLAGADGEVASHVRLGFLAGYSHDRFDVDGRDASGSSDNYHLGLYGGAQPGALGVRAGVAYTWHDVSTRRAIAFPGFADRLTADYDADTFQAFGELGYRIDTAAASFEPFANLAYARLHTAGFTEQGGDAALSSPSQDTDTTFTTFGIRASTRLDLGGTTATARGTLGWRHAYGDTTPRTTLAFAGGDAFTVAGAPIAEDAAVLRAGLDFAIGRDAALRVSYTGQFGDHAYDNGAEASLDVVF